MDLSLVSIDSTTARAHHDAAGMHMSEDVLTVLEKAAAEEEKGRSKGAVPKNKADEMVERIPSGRSDDASVAAPELQDRAPEAAVDSDARGAGSSRLGEGSGSGVGEGSLAYKESLRTDSPEDEGALFSPAVGEVPVVAVENPSGANAGVNGGRGGLALRAGGNNHPAPKPKSEKRSNSGGRPSFTGPQLAMSAEVYAVLEPVHWLLARAPS